ncbi:MAG: sugar nucleotide-binding protein, partial [Phyllobacterium sp.]
TNWGAFAREIFRLSSERRGPYSEVNDILTSEYPTKARRPLNSRLSTDLFFGTFGWRAPDWRQSLRQVVERILADREV